MKNRIVTAFLIGSATFIVAYFALIGFAMLRFSYYSGPVPDLFYGLPIPLMLGALAAMIAFQVKNPN